MSNAPAHRRRPGTGALAWALALALLWSQGLALLHGTLHLQRGPAGSTASGGAAPGAASRPAFALPVAVPHGLERQWQGSHHRVGAHAPACHDAPRRGLVRLVERLLGNHGDGGLECRLYDLATHADAIVGGADLAAAPAASPGPAASQRLAAVEAAREAARNRGPPGRPAPLPMT
jgi:hypothetical protein